MGVQKYKHQHFDKPSTRITNKIQRTNDEMSFELVTHDLFKFKLVYKIELQMPFLLYTVHMVLNRVYICSLNKTST